MQSSVYSEQRITRAKSILEKNLNKSKGAEVSLFQIYWTHAQTYNVFINVYQKVSLSAQTFLFSEMLQYAQKRVNGIQDLERK